MKRLCTAIAIISSLTLLACSRDRRPIDRPSESSEELQKLSQEEQNLPTHKTIFMTWVESLNKPIKNYDNDCVDCPPSVAQVLVRGNSRCYGSLVKDDLILTSRHCLPKKYLIKGLSCENTIRFIFSGNQDVKAEAVDCDEVVDFIPEPQWAIRQRKKSKRGDITPHPDWVLLRTKKKMPERSAETQPNGIGDAEKLFVYLPQFNNHNRTISVKKVECESVQGTPFFPYFIHNKSPMASIKCKEQLTNGSSGSNIYNQAGQIVGTLSHGLAYIRSGKKRRFKRFEGNKYSPWIAVNNIACILDVKDEDKDGCKFDPKQKKNLRRQIFLTHLKEAEIKAEDIFSQWKDSANLPIEWETVDTLDLDSIPESYQKIFEERKSERKHWLDEAGNIALTKLFLPAYPKCMEQAVDSMNVPHPYAEVKIERTSMRRVVVHVEFKSTKGMILKKGDNQWGYHFLTGHRRPLLGRSNSHFFHPGHPPLPHQTLSLCK